MVSSMVQVIPFNPDAGFVMCRLTPGQLQFVWDEVRKIRDDFESATPAHHSLVGHIKHEYELKCLDNLTKLVKPLAMIYANNFGYAYSLDMNDDNVQKKVVSAWVNFQSKTEFNPIHNHTGMFSFVIWLHVPFLIEDEAKCFPSVHDDNNMTAHFSFLSIEANRVARHNIPVDRSFENTIVLFPSSQCHCVYPFYTSDNYRISVSGNFAKVEREA